MHVKPKLTLAALMALVVAAGCDIEDNEDVVGNDLSDVAPRRFFFGINPTRQLEDNPEIVSLHRLGVHNVRTTIYWNQFQDADCDGKALGPISFENRDKNLDKKVERAAKHDITIIAVFHGTRLPDNCSHKPTEFPQPGSSLYNDFVSEDGFVWKVVQRYGVDGDFWHERRNVPYHPIRVWEVWNEENWPTNNWNQNGDQNDIQNVNPQNYARFLIDTSAVIRLAQKNQSEKSGRSAEFAKTKVLMGGLAPFEKAVDITKYFDSIYSDPTNPQDNNYYTAAQFHTAFDGLSYHPYALRGGPDVVEDHIRNARNVLDKQRSELGDDSDANKTLWITEIGWPMKIFDANDIYQLGVDESTQAEYLSDTLDWIYGHAENLRIRYAAWYNNVDSLGYSNLGKPNVTTCHSTGCWDRICGLRRSDGSNRPAWSRYANLIRGFVENDPL